ncbi:hypothetical protein [Cupriavidus alkaliphilus]|uniref:hypothetical protein n=1 Tax=Cupriavidus alkaliphilus TaxID=942866 RepID=UPI0016181B41|nr:hypothetical protein [Cupriavidus alkaliphilus]MBB2918341.1 putative phage protein gp47/JayE [Cupriavidus alkaliphilus]
MAYGLTPDGFVRKRLPEIRQEIVADWEARLRAKGYAGPVETRPDSVIGLLIDTFSDREETLWELAEGVYYAMYPPTASGVSLDNSVAYAGAKRLAAEPSRCYVVLYGAEGTAVQPGAQIRHRTTQTLWGIVDGTTISRENAADLRIEVTAVAANSDYTVVINNVPYTYRSGVAPNVASIIYGIAGSLLPTGLNVESNAAAVRVFTDGRAAFAAVVSPNLRMASIGTPALAETFDDIAEVALPGDLSQIVTQTPGWASVINLQPGAVGRASENDAQLRARYKYGIYRLGAATLPSISANLKELVPGVLALKVFENDTDEPDEYGRPPHSLHVVIDGGLDQEVADAIFRLKAAGIDTHGDMAMSVLDDGGTTHEIRYDRPHKVYVWAKARVMQLPPEESEFPIDGHDRIQRGIAAAGDTLGIGEDIVLQKLYSGVYTTPGVAMVDLRLACSTDPTYVPADADYVEANYPVMPFERADFDVSRVEVVAWT